MVTGNAIREIIAAALAIVIVGFTIYCMHTMLDATTNADGTLWQHRSSILQSAVALAGTVIGYYFGRIPAERATSIAQQAATSANQNLAGANTIAQEATAKERQLRDGVKVLRASLVTPTGGGAAECTGSSHTAEIATRLDELLRR